MLNLPNCKREGLTLAIETSCDETSCSVVENGRRILSNVISSQVNIHRKFGGVVPEIASRKHIENVMAVIEEALVTANVSLQDISVMGVTYGPGLVGALLVGVSAAKALAYALDIPLVGVNHLEGHIFANFLENQDLEPPLMALVVSGGHTSLVYLKDYNTFTLLGQTRDDAAGEAFDKIARVMGMPYPGGPQIEKLAKNGHPTAIEFPRAAVGGYEFSFSGLKSAVINYLHNAEQREERLNTADVAASFQAAVLDVLVKKTILAAEEYEVDTIVLAGGVAANGQLQRQLGLAAQVVGKKLYYPSMELCTDNAAMIACRTYYQHLAGQHADLYLNAKPSLKIGTMDSCGK